MLRGLHELNNSSTTQIKCADQGYDCNGCASQGGNCYKSKNMKKCCNDNGCTWDKTNPQQCGSEHTPTPNNSINASDAAANKCLSSYPNSINEAEACCRRNCNNDNQCIGDCQSIVSGQEPSPNSGPDGCPTAYFDQNSNPNFTGTCDDNSTGGYDTCCRCGGMSGVIGQCPSGCIDSNGNCIPSGSRPPSQPSLPTKRGCYSKDAQGKYFKMDIDNPTKCKSPNIWVNGNGGSSPQPSDKCTYFKSLQTGNCINLSKDTKWTDDVYNSLIKATSENTEVNSEIATCIVNKMTQEFDSPLSTFASANETKITNIGLDCAKCNGKCGGNPKLYSAKSSPGPGPDKNKTIDYVFIGLIGLCILIFVGMLLSNSVRQNKTRLTVVVITIAILITVFVALLYTTIHKK